ncbi:hypothetical protein ABID26_007170 [Mesorhizobium shonense]|uniref:Uncharacterized protein n=1 Tax=Mesorhizobium shonense TaxID=1209948 RepID=A0ABV2I532_9HYPH
MKELNDILAKYQGLPLPVVGDALPALEKFAKLFFADCAEIYDIFTRVKDTERNPSGFSLVDAPILGLLVKISKIMREIVKYYDSGDANVIAYLERQAIEAAVVARYLLSATPETIESYRKCSFKDRLAAFEAAAEGFYATKAGKRLKASIADQFEAEGLNASSFELQKKQNWKVDGKSVRDMFAEIGMGDLYGSVYGFGSESIHASWGHSINFDLSRNTDGTYSALPIEMPADVRYVGPVLLFCNPAYVGWCKRIGLGRLVGVLNWIDQVNRQLFDAFDAVYQPMDG